MSKTNTKFAPHMKDSVWAERMASELSRCINLLELKVPDDDGFIFPGDKIVIEAAKQSLQHWRKYQDQSLGKIETCDEGAI